MTTARASPVSRRRAPAASAERLASRGHGGEGPRLKLPWTTHGQGRPAARGRAIPPGNCRRGTGAPAAARRRPRSGGARGDTRHARGGAAGPAAAQPASAWRCRRLRALGRPRLRALRCDRAACQRHPVRGGVVAAALGGRGGRVAREPRPAECRRGAPASEGGAVDLQHCGPQRRLCARMDRAAPRYGEAADYSSFKGY